MNNNTHILKAIPDKELNKLILSAFNKIVYNKGIIDKKQFDAINKKINKN